MSPILASLHSLVSKLCSIRSLGTRSGRAPRFHIVLPSAKPFHYAELADCTRQLIIGIQQLAKTSLGESVDVLLFDAGKRNIWRLADGKDFSLSEFDAARIHVVLNPGFLLADPPPIKPLVDLAFSHALAWCGTKSSRELHAFAFSPAFGLTRTRLRSLFALVTSCVGEDNNNLWDDLLIIPSVLPGASCADNSPAMRGISNVRCRSLSDAPRFVNTAFLEMLSNPQDFAEIASTPGRMAQALLAQRGVSKVPWIFNSLLNEIEYRTGITEPDSFPPEVHLSVTGACNIECRFCGYTHSISRSDFVEPAQIDKLQFLRHVRTLRLHSGHGEPAMNRHLPAIIERLAANSPHISLNFFTNGVLLDRPGLIPAIVGNVRWINVSLSASTRESWQQQCGVDLFERVCNNVRELHRVKRAQGSLFPLVFGSMVLTRSSIADLPGMPALCRELGVDRFTAFPYSGLGYAADKYGPDMTLAAWREQYDESYSTTLREAESHGISLEIPLPSYLKTVILGAEVRGFYDFAHIESNEWRLGRFLTNLHLGESKGSLCEALWRSASIGSTYNIGHDERETHYLYPCLGPLSGLDLSRIVPFRFPDENGFRRLWCNPLYSHLRRAQQQPGLCAVCDICRRSDTRDPAMFPILKRVVAEFADSHCDHRNGPSGDL